jgi:peptidoglycan/LPS O-acetylase OafA/YrhL
MGERVAQEQAVAGGRLAYLDNLKVLLVIGVIAVHSAITYGVDGSWYLEDYDSMTDVSVGSSSRSASCSGWEPSSSLRDG